MQRCLAPLRTPRPLSVLAWLAVLPWAVWAVVRLLGAERGYPFVQLLAGDFNSTLDHHELRKLVDRGYRDAAEAVGAGFSPTWQGHRAPPVTIDHVLVPERVGVLGVEVHELPRSDHRAVLGVLALPEG